MAASLEEIVNAMQQAVELDGSIKRKFNATVLFDVEGQKHTLHAKKKGGTSDKPDLSVSTSLETLQDLLNKKTTPQKAFMQGKLKIKGKMGLAMKLNLVLNGTRKHLEKQNARL